jgi:hypothetical protein
MDPETMPQFETPMRLGWKAQSQSRLALEALAMLKQGTPTRQEAREAAA